MWCRYSNWFIFQYSIHMLQGNLYGGVGRFHILFLFFVAAMFALSLVSLFTYHIYLVALNRTTLGEMLRSYNNIWFWAKRHAIWRIWFSIFDQQKPFEHQYFGLEDRTRMVLTWADTTISKRCLVMIGDYGCCRYSPGKYKIIEFFVVRLMEH